MRGLRLTSSSLRASLIFPVLKTLGRGIGWFFHLSGEGLENLSALDPPFLILANHASNLDPVFVNLFAPSLIRFVASDSLIRTPLSHMLFALMDIIPITKQVADTGTLRGIFQARRDRRIISLFPEGHATWDGTTLPLTPGTARLVQALRVPVITATIRGAFLAAGRWRRRAVRGPVSVRFHTPLPPDHLTPLPPPAVEDLLASRLAHDEWEAQKQEPLPLLGPRAEYLERTLFLCPSCLSHGTLRSSLHTLSCTVCGLAIQVDPFGFLLGPIPFTTMKEWNTWQRGTYPSLLSSLPEHSPILSAPASLLTGPLRTRPHLLASGTLSLHRTHLRLTTPSGNHALPLDRIRGLNIQKHERLEFLLGPTLHRIAFHDPRTSAYLWYFSLHLLKEHP